MTLSDGRATNIPRPDRDTVLRAIISAGAGPGRYDLGRLSNEMQDHVIWAALRWYREHGGIEIYASSASAADNNPREGEVE